MKHGDGFYSPFLLKKLILQFADRIYASIVIYRNKINFILEPHPYFAEVVWSEYLARNIVLLSGSEGRRLRKGAASG